MKITEYSIKPAGNAKRAKRHWGFAPNAKYVNSWKFDSKQKTVYFFALNARGIWSTGQPWVQKAVIC